MFTPVLFLTVALTLQTGPAAAPPPAGPARPATPVSTDQIAEAYLLFVQGRALGDNNDLAGAIAKYREALKSLPGSAEIHAEIASALAQQGELDGARTEAEQGLALEPGNRSCHRVLGLIDAESIPRTRSQDADRIVASAIDHLERAKVDGVRDPLVQLTLGQLYLRAGQSQNAIGVLRDFLLDRPGYPQAVMLLVQAYRDAGQPDEAQALIDEISGRAPATPQSRVRDAGRFEQEGDWAGAATAWAKVLADDPDNAAYRLRYGAALANSGNLEKGRTILRAVVRDEPDDVSAWYLLAQVEQRAGDDQAAEDAARRIGTIDPSDARGPLALAVVRDARGDTKGVVAALEARVAKPADADLTSGAYVQMARTLASALIDLKKNKQAIRVMQDARRRLPDDHEVLFGLAATCEQAHQYDQAERAFRELIAADPSHAPALNYLGYMLAERGRKLDEAVSLIQRALAIDADNPSYLDSLGWAYYKLKRFDEALDPLGRAAAAVPDSSVIQSHLGDLYLELGRYRDAAAAFDRALSGDRDEVDAKALTKKRDRARSLQGTR